MITLEQAFTIAWNILLGIAILFLIYNLMKRWIKQFMLEALHEHESMKKNQEAMSRVQAIRNKYS
jgi:hypothetical protein